MAGRWRDQDCRAAPEVYATAYFNSRGPLAGWIEESEEDRNVWDGLSLIAQRMGDRGRPRSHHGAEVELIPRRQPDLRRTRRREHLELERQLRPDPPPRRTIPDTRMKAQREHRVPLCGRALEMLREAGRLSPVGAGEEPTGLVFPSRRGKALSEGGISKLVKLLGIAAVPHGFRSSFRDWAAEQTNHPREVIEAALAHVVQSRVEAAYARSDLFERRRVLMNDWAAYLGAERGQVMALRR